MSGLTNAYLDDLSKHLIGKSFLGVFPADGLSSMPKKKMFCLIFNTDLMKNPGKHFVSIFVSQKKTYYFDSFGNPKIQKHIASFIKKTKRPCVMHCEVIQDKTSNFCGFYALAFLLWMKKRKRSGGFYNLFRTKQHLISNDSSVTKFILKEIK